MSRLRYNGLATGSAGALTALDLGGSLTNSATSVTFNAALTYNNGTAVPTIVSPDYIPLTIRDAAGNVSEIVYLTAYTAAATTGTITRGEEGTTGVAHSSGDKIVHAPTTADVGWSSVVNDDLSAMTGFKTALNGTWSIISSVLNQSVTTASPTHITYNTDVTPATHRAAEVEANYASGSGSTRRMGLFATSNNASSGNLVVYAQSAAGTSWVLVAESDFNAVLFTSATIAYAGSGYLKIGVIQSGNSFDLYADGVWVGNFVSSNYTGGQWVGLYTHGAEANFRNLKAWALNPTPF